MIIKATFNKIRRGRRKLVTYRVSKKNVNKVLAWLLNHEDINSVFTLTPVVSNTNFIRTYQMYPWGWASNSWLQPDDN